MSTPRESDDYLNIDTPENVAFGYEVAGIGSRFLAALIDSFAIVVLQVVTYFTLLMLAAVFSDSGLVLSEDAGFVWVAAILGLVAFAFFWGYYIFFEMLWNGQSLGKRWVGLRVIRADGTPITLTESIVRNLVRLIDFLPLYYGVGVVVMFIDRQSRRLGDMAAGTLVVRDRRPVTLESLAARPITSDVPGIGPNPATDWPVKRLTNRDVELAEDFLRRRYELANRAALAGRIAQTLLARMGLPDDPAAQSPENAEKTIAEIVRARRVASGE